MPPVQIFFIDRPYTKTRFEVVVQAYLPTLSVSKIRRYLRLRHVSDAEQLTYNGQLLMETMKGEDFDLKQGCVLYLVPPTPVSSPRPTSGETRPSTSSSQEEDASPHNPHGEAASILQVSPRRVPEVEEAPQPPPKKKKKKKKKTPELKEDVVSAPSPPPPPPPPPPQQQQQAQPPAHLSVPTFISTRTVAVQRDAPPPPPTIEYYECSICSEDDDEVDAALIDLQQRVLHVLERIDIVEDQLKDLNSDNEEEVHEQHPQREP